MPDLSTYDSWPAVAALALVLLCFQIPSLVSTIRTHRDTKVIREHTENEHDEADYPNMRDEITAIRRAVEGLTEAVGDTQSSLAEHVTQADAWQTSVEQDLARRRRPLLSWRY